MAEIIPMLNSSTLGRMTPGEKRVARRLQSLLEDDYLVWYDIPVGKSRRYPDFIILHPARGLLFLEVKDWKSETITKITKSQVTLVTDTGLATKPHPLEQARQYAYPVINQLLRDSLLRRTSGDYQGNLIMPYGWGVVFTNITRRQIQKWAPDDMRAQCLPDHLVLYKDEITENADAETFQEHLWGMFHYRFGATLALPQIDRIRWHLFPEIRIDENAQMNLFVAEDGASGSVEDALPDIVKIMDIQQEQLARSLGDGHRVIHGVAGSGKTLILGYRCVHLAEITDKPILVLCFNITLAAKLRAFISSRGIGGQVQVYHFHDWCGQQLKTSHVNLIKGDKPVWELQVETVIHAVEKGQIPRSQYGALLIDEAHDFAADWLKLVVQMIDPKSNSLLLLYDDAQSIYTKCSGLGFSLSSVGVQAKGRTTILRVNYRNSREILTFAYAFVSRYLNPHGADDDHIPLIAPEIAGLSGPPPVVRQFSRFEEEIDYTVKCVKQWHQRGVRWGDMAILYAKKVHGRLIAMRLHEEQVPHLWLDTGQNKKVYNPNPDHLTLLTLHSSKGLEFPRVIIVGVGQLNNEEGPEHDARLLYVGMTRAQQCLLMTTSGQNEYSRHLSTLAAA